TDLIGATRRGRVRRTVFEAGASVLVLATIVALAATVGPSPTPLVSPGAPPHVTTLADRTGRFGIPIGGRFVDAQHGFVQLLQCPYTTLSRSEVNGPDFRDTRCHSVLEVTSDGGKTFQSRELPSTLGADSEFHHSELYVFDPTHLVLNQPAATVSVPATGGASSGTLIGVDIPARRWISSNAGASWTPVSLQPGSPVATIPPDSQLAGASPDDYSPAVMSSAGVTHPIVSAVNMFAPDFYANPPWAPLGEVDGAYYAYPGHPSSDLGLMVSRDNGATWRTLDRPPQAHNVTVIGSDGQWLYATAASDPSGPGDLVLASNDRGRTWHATGIPPLLDTDFGINYAISPSSGLLYCDGTRVWHADGTGPLLPIPDTVKTEHLVGLGSVVVGTRVTRTGVISLAVSIDGIHWRDATLR
ncbi:MAG TPA: hypothetical protein VH442_15615, partial [Micromonosporaceae bacterium]